MNNKILKKIILEEIKNVLSEENLFEVSLADIASWKIPAGDILTAWKIFPKAPKDLKTTMDLGKIGTAAYSAFREGGITSELSSVFARNIVFGLVKVLKKSFEAGVTSFKGTADIIKNTMDTIRGILELCKSFNIDPGGYFSKFLASTGEGAVAGIFLEFLSVLLGTYALYEFLADTGKEFKKIKGPLALKELRLLEDRIKKEGFEAVKKSVANNCTSQHGIFKYISDARSYYPNVRTMFPNVYKLIDARCGINVGADTAQTAQAQQPVGYQSRAPAEPVGVNYDVLSASGVKGAGAIPSLGARQRKI